MTYNEFVARWNGQGNNFDSAFGYQCMDLVEQYNKDVVGAPRIGGNAVDAWSRASSNFYDKIVNYPWTVPQVGDIVVFGKPLGYINGVYYGHIAIVAPGSNLLTLQTFSQNYPYGSLTHFQPMSYKGCIGFLRPKKPITTPAPAPVSSSFTVRVDKVQAAVRTAPKVNAPLSGTQLMYKGATFIAVGTVQGDNVSGNSTWYKSAKGNYVWSGGLTRI